MTKTSEERKKYRKKLFDEQNGQCHWCHQSMTLDNNPGPGKENFLPGNYATLEHMYDRLSSKRKVNTKDKRVVLACKDCNHERGRLREHIAKTRGHSIITYPRKHKSERRLVYSTEK